MISRSDLVVKQAALKVQVQQSSSFITERSSMAATEDEIQQYIRFVIKCRIPTQHVVEAFGLSTTFNPIEQLQIVRELRTLRKELKSE